MMTEPAPLELWRETVKPEWVDYNGHMNVAYYTLVFDHAVDAFFTHIGMGRDYRDAMTCSTFTVEHHITYDREVLEGDGLICRTRLVGFDEKRIITTRCSMPRKATAPRPASSCRCIWICPFGGCLRFRKKGLGRLPNCLPNTRSCRRLRSWAGRSKFPD